MEAELSIQDLPDEILGLIISYIPIPKRSLIRQVCRRWKKVGDRWDDITSLVIVDYDNENPEPELKLSKGVMEIITRRELVVQQVMARCAPVLRALTDRRLRENSLSIAVQVCHRLENMNVRTRTMQQDLELTALVLENPLLVHLKLQFGLNNNCTCFLAIDAKIIESLEILTCHPSREFVTRLKHLIRKLQNIKKFHCDCLDDEALLLLSEKTTIQSLIVCESSYMITDIGLLSIMNLTNLTVIGINCEHNLGPNKMKITLDLVKTMVTKCTKLEEVSFNGCFFITDDVFPVLSRLKNLKKLFITCCREVRGQLAYTCNRIELLSLEFCRRVTNHGLIRLIRESDSIERLILVGASITEDLLYGANAAVRAVPGRAPLSLFVSTGLTPSAGFPDQSALLHIYESYPIFPSGIR